MLTAVKSGKAKAGKAQVAIVASRYNSRYVDAMVRAAMAELKRAGARKIQLVRVPGAYEIPVVVSRLARVAADARESFQEENRLSAVICLGVILRGATVHAAHIGDAVSRALMDIQLRYEVPVVHEVLLLENEDQARERCLSKTHNRGAEAAQTALAMVKVMSELGAESRGLDDVPF
jgi:6,7-dimethyl-8-ribityllumazine synthase